LTFLRGERLAKSYIISRGWWQKEEIQAVHDVSLDLDLDIEAGKNVGLVGESGSGKSTLVRLLSRLERPSRGCLHYRGKEISTLPEKQLTSFRRQVQIIFQDAAASLNPRHPAEKILAEPLRNYFPAFSRKERRDKIDQVLQQVGLSPEDRKRYPHEFSGGQQRRLAIARAVIVNPFLVICDEATSGLDVSLQGQLLNLFLDLGEKFGVHYLLVSHDLPAVRYLCQRVVVMYAGRIVEDLPANRLDASLHPYTRALLKSEPRLEGSFSPQFLPGEPPDSSAYPAGCPFHPRCPERIEICAREQPFLKEISARHRAACHLAGKQ